MANPGYILNPHKQAACAPQDTELSNRRENDLRIALRFAYELIYETGVSDESVCLMLSHMKDSAESEQLPGMHENRERQFVNKIRPFEQTVHFELHDILVKPFRCGHVVMLLHVLKACDSEFATAAQIKAICLGDDATAEWLSGLGPGTRRLYAHIRRADRGDRLEGWHLFLRSENSPYMLHRVEDDDDDDNDDGDTASSSSSQGDSIHSDSVGGGPRDGGDHPPPQSPRGPHTPEQTNTTGNPTTVTPAEDCRCGARFL